MKIVTFNIRFMTDDGINHDGINYFYNRIGFIRQKLKAERPDVIAFQEVTEEIREALIEMLPEYDIFGSMRTADFDGEGLYTAVRRDKYEVLGIETVWLSPTPYVAGSRFSMQSGCPRPCVMLYIRNLETGFRMRTFNIHLDHFSDEARLLGMQAAFKYIDGEQAKEALPYVILGDYNAEPSDMPIAFANARKDVEDITADLPYTFHGWGQRKLKIDYIYATEELQKALVKVAPWTDEHCGIYLSDHFPIAAEFDI